MLEKKKAIQIKALSFFLSVYFYLLQPECLCDKVYILPHCCYNSTRCIDFISCVCFVKKISSPTLLSFCGNGRVVFLPSHLDIVNHIIVQLVLKQ